MHAISVRSLHSALGLQPECVVIVVASVTEAADYPEWPLAMDLPVCTDTPQQYANKTSVTICMLWLGNNDFEGPECNLPVCASGRQAC